MLNITRIPAPRVALVDSETGLMSRQWFRFFNNIYTIVGANLGVIQIENGGTGLSTAPTNGQLLIGDTVNGYVLNTLNPADGITVTNGAGTITLTNTGVLSFSGGNTGLTPATATNGNVVISGLLNVASGGTNQSSYVDGELLIGNTTGNTLTKSTLTAGTGLTITNGNGAITPSITATGVTALGYGSASNVGTFTVNAQGQLTTAADVSIAINGNQITSGNVSVLYGGTGQTSYTDGQLLIGNSSGNTLTKATLTAGSGVTITNGAGAITINATGSGGTVTSVTGTAPVSVATGTTTPVISLASGYGDTQNPYASKTANYVLAAPNGSAGVPTFRALVSADIPSLSSIYIPYTGASAAIDLNAQTVVNIAHLGIGTTSVPTILLRAVGDNNSTSRIAVRGYSSNANSSAIRVTKFRGTVAAPQAPQSGDSLGKFELAGYGTTSSEGYPQASFEGLATEAWGATARGAKTVIKVTPNTTTTQVTAVTVDQDSKVTLAGALAVTGTTTLATSLSGLAKLTSGVVSTATSGTDYAPATSGSSILYGNGAGGFSNVTIGTGVAFVGGTLSATGSGGTVTSVTGTAPVVSSGGATPAISMPAATTSVSGYLTNTDWNTFNNKSNTNGTVTSVSFTGGIVSVATATTTPAFTIAGTSGGIPYFNSATTWATSAALTANALVKGGGAGVAPSTVTTGTGVLTALGVNTNSAGSFVVYNNDLGTPSSGVATNLTGLPLTTGVTGTLPTANGGTNLTTFTANGVVYASSTSALATGSGLTYNGTTLSTSADASIHGVTVGLGGGSGTNSTALGNGAIGTSNTGASNVAVGYKTLAANTSGSNSTAIGYQAATAETSGGASVYLGYQAGANITTGSNNTYLGYQSSASSVSVVGEIVICAGGTTGKGGSTGYINAGGGGTYQGNNSAAWSITSDQRLKKNIVDNTDGLNKITAIQVRNFEYRLPNEITALSEHSAIDIKGVQLGAIAQEIQLILPECVKTETTGVMSVDATNLTWYLINAVKELNTKFDAYVASHP